MTTTPSPTSSPAAIAAGSWLAHPDARAWTCPPAPADIRVFHEGLPGYAPTPAVDLPAVAELLCVARVVVKDESSRLGLPAFKALGVSYAMYRVICERAGRTITPTDWDSLRGVVATLGPLQFVAATDGNHGRAVARFSRLLGVPAHIFVPDVVTPSSIRAIQAEGAHVSVLSEDYDKTVQLAADEAERQPNAVLIQDTAWPGYEDIPQWIVDGYSTLFAELDDQLALGDPTEHGSALVVTPMGVGSLAQAAVVHYRSHPNSASIAVLGVEPDSAACIQVSMRAGRATSIATASTIMDGLNCGTPSSLAWPYLRDGMDGVVAVSDEQAADAVNTLNALAVEAGPCGAATMAAARIAASAPELRESLGLTSESTIVLLNTEGPRPAAAQDVTAARAEDAR
ncbi:Diaminopropionate ammonia-lyase [Blastococcus saxobsidens DD2]|uniref:Diaminopropionate ammonia-lyase n=1 Tax=Blastococcus saxobsidens (strain DD2) TaxID=1146883 RepID=H6RMF5_BLASD|nr:Diaminopropionate ammonia-lyase [Blastococcus saxobsidens DD2]